MKRRKKLLRQDIPVLEADPEKGLTRDQAAQRTEKGWANGQSISAGKTEWDIVAQNLFTFFNLVFVVLAVALALAGSSIKNMTFLIVVVCNLCIGCYQEIRAKRAVDKLTLVAAQKLRTVRDGKVEILPSDQLVRDDIVEFLAGVRSVPTRWYSPVSFRSTRR
jgi:cation-transporting ATPase E